MLRALRGMLRTRPTHVTGSSHVQAWSSRGRYFLYARGACDVASMTWRACTTEPAPPRSSGRVRVRFCLAPPTTAPPRLSLGALAWPHAHPRPPSSTPQLSSAPHHMCVSRQYLPCAREQACTWRCARIARGARSHAHARRTRTCAPVHAALPRARPSPHKEDTVATAQLAQLHSFTASRVPLHRFYEPSRRFGALRGF